MKKLSTNTQFSQFFAASGMPNSMVAVLVYLLLCEPSRQSATAIEQATLLSKGSVNNSLQSLIKSGLIVVTRNESERQYYYEIDPGGWQRAIDRRLASLLSATTIAKQGLQEFPDNVRLKAMHDAYKLFSDQFNSLKIKS